jgi:ankyrin repeat protein
MNIAMENKELVENLIGHKADINKEIRNGETTLINACRSGNKELEED